MVSREVMGADGCVCRYKRSSFGYWEADECFNKLQLAMAGVRV